MIDLFHLLLQSNKESSFVFVRFIIKNFQRALWRTHEKYKRNIFYIFRTHILNRKVEIGQQIRFAIEKVLIGSEKSMDGKWLMGRQLYLNILHNELQFISNVLQLNSINLDLNFNEKRANTQFIDVDYEFTIL